MFIGQIAIEQRTIIEQSAMIEQKANV